MAKLENYRHKRNFRKTPEPAGRVARRPARNGGLFVVHKHAARRLHYDLRLERDGVLESWAVPKGPGRKPGEKRLAVHVEDHPLEYGEFEGVIPQGQYGGGTVMLWDRGHWRETKRRDGRIDFELEGHKLRGSWTLTRMGSTEGEKDNWLLIKRSDDGGNDAAPALDPVPEERSVATGRTMRQITEANEGSGPPQAELAVRELPGARSGSLPAAPRPQLATLTDATPRSSGWIHEIKFDGYRVMARLDQREVRLISRNGKDWTHRFPEIARELSQLPVSRALLDGEVIALNTDGTSSFRALQEALSVGRTAELIYQVFDLIHVDGTNLAGTPLLERKQALETLLERSGFVGSARIRYTQHLEGAAATFYQEACRLGLEGIICKRSAAPYQPARNRDWLKIKCSRHQELLIGGFTEPAGSRTGFGALLLGGYGADGRLTYAGKVGTGFNQRQLSELAATLRRYRTDDCPFEPRPKIPRANWVRPELVAEVEFTEWTRDGRLRHPSFRGVREDRNPEDIRMPQSNRDAPRPAQQPAGRSGGGRRKNPPRAGVARQQGTAEVAGVTITHPDRVLYPEQGATKLGLARYYEDVAEWILPELRQRPLVLVRCPQGRAHQCFYQKHPGEAMSADVPRTLIQEKSGRAEYLYLEQVPHLIALIQAGTLELHAWGSRVDDLEHPDTVVFDLDPGEDVAWRAVLATAKDLGERLTDLGLASFVRTTGGKGLHVVVPLEPRQGWEAVKDFARGVAEMHAADDPDRLTTNMSKARRRGRIFIDYLRNGRGATAIASYSTRARPGAPVAVPLRWDELGQRLRSNPYDIDNVRRRLSSLGSDPWADFRKSARPLTTAMRKAVAPRGRRGR